MTAALNDPIVAAERKSMSDVTGIGGCPLTLENLQLIPVRYAYAEEPSQHSAVDPRYPTEFRPTGLRVVRHGYLYLFHASAPDILQEYIVTEGGAVEQHLWEGAEATAEQQSQIPDEASALVVARTGHVDVLFTDVRLSDRKRKMLLQWQDYRNEVMRRVDIASYRVEAGTAHLLPKSALEEHLVHPEPGNTENGEPDCSWYWAADTDESQTEPFSHRLADYDKDHAYLVVDDLTGQLADLLDAWAYIDTAHNAWLEREDSRYYSASFIQGLIKLDAETVSSFVDAAIAQSEDPELTEALERVADASPAQRERMAALARDFQPGPLDVRRARTEEVKARKAQNQAVEALSSELGVASDITTTMLTALHKHQHRSEHGSWTGERGVRDFVELEAMQSYLKEAETSLAAYAEEKARIIRSIEALLPAFHLLGHMYDREEEETYKSFLGLENAAISVLSDQALTTGDYTFLTEYYFGDAGHQHLVGFDIDPAAFAGSIGRLLASFKTVLDARDTPSSHDDWLSTLEENPQLRFATLTPALSAELSHRLGQLSVVARQELFSLVQKATDARLHDRLKNLFRNMGPGLRAHLLENQLIYKLDLALGDEADLKRADALVSQAESAAAEYQKTLNRENHLESRREKSKGRIRRETKDRYDSEIRRLREVKKQHGTDFRTALGELDNFSPIEGDGKPGALLIGGLKSTAEGRSIRAELDELTRLSKRSGMTGVMDHARGLIHGKDAMDVTKRVGGLGIVSFVGLVSFAGTVDALLSRDKDSDWTWKADLAAGAFGTMSALSSVSTIVASARLNYYYQMVSKSEAILTRLARANVWGGTVAAWGGFFAAGADAVKQLYIATADNATQGEKVGAGITFVGDLMIARGSGRIAVEGTRGLYHLLIKKTAGVTWASVHSSMLSLSGGLFRGMNAWLWVGSGLVLAGQYVANRHQRTQVQEWCLASAWGREPRQWSADEQRFELAQRIYAPELRVMAEREALDGDFRHFSLRLFLPGVSGLTPEKAQWVVLERNSNGWNSATRAWQDSVRVGSSGSDGTTVQASLLFDELPTLDGIHLAVRYKPDGVTRWLPGPDSEFHFSLALGEQGNLPYVGANEDKNWQPVAFRDEAPDQVKPLLGVYKPIIPEKDDE